LEYFTARLSRWRDFAQDAKTGKSTAFPFAAETSAKENKAEKEKIFSLRTLRLAVKTTIQFRHDVEFGNPCT